MNHKNQPIPHPDHNLGNTDDLEQYVKNLSDSIENYLEDIVTGC